MDCSSVTDPHPQIFLRYPSIVISPGASNYYSFSSNVSAQIMQLSERAAELAVENDHLMEQNRDKCRQIELLESEQQHLIRQSSNR